MSSGVSLILPTYNSGDLIGGRLPELAKTLAQVFDPVEVIVVDDASDDAFREFVDQSVDEIPEVRLLRNAQNLGKGASVLIGIAAATQPKVIFTDADIPFDSASYRRLAEMLVDGAPAVIGCRRRNESQILARFDALWYAGSRHVIGIMFNKMVRAMTGLEFVDTQCGLKGFDREVALSLFRRVQHPRFLFDIELLIAATQTGTPVVEVPVCVIYEDSRSTLSVGFESWQLGRDMLRMWGRVRRNEYHEDPVISLLDRIKQMSSEVV
jgi:glycosyltransferase involved in cell wall biosynthesis